MVPARTSHAVLVLLAAIALVLLLVIAKPFATSLFLAAVLAGAFAPWHLRLADALGGRCGASAGIITAAVLVAVVGPFSALGAALVPQIGAGFAWLRQALQGDGLSGLVAKLPASLQPVAERMVADLPASLDRLQEVATAQGGRAAAVLGNVLSATGSFLLQSILMLVAFFFMLRDGHGLVHWLNDAIPLKRGQFSELLRDFRNVTVTVLVSTIATAGVQTLIAFVGYLIAGVPNAVFFAFVTFLLALVPFVGATAVVIAIAVVKLLTGHTTAGIFLAIYGFGVVAMCDNVVKPLFIRGGVPIHGAVIFFALFGGLAAFGPVGFLVGPLAISFVVAVVRIYRRDYGQ
jgi:predicted PurR-regulated permease PerM